MAKTSEQRRDSMREATRRYRQRRREMHPFLVSAPLLRSEPYPRGFVVDPVAVGVLETQLRRGGLL